MKGRASEGDVKRIPRDPEKFEVIDLFSAIGRRKGLRLGDAKSEKRFLSSVSKSYQQSKENTIVLHGRRTESMFAYVAASLGKAQVVKEEDAGEVYAVDPTILPPDYRIVLEDGYEFLVEVKNYHQSKPTAPFKMKESYLKRLIEYARLFKKDLKVAVYWSRWNKWTLHAVDKLPSVSKGREIALTDAFTTNEMSLLGDFIVGTTPPLVLRLTADPSKPRTVDSSSGNVLFTIGGVEFYCAGTRIEEKVEKGLAFYLILHGDWEEKEPHAKIEDGKLVWIDFENVPREPVEPEQEFEMIGTASGMISRRYHELTMSSKGVERLVPSAEPDTLGLRIPDGYKGKQLPLWRFIVKPK
jgi:hypothetical protein